MFKTKWKFGIYSVSFKDFIKIMYIKSVLKLKRIKRLILRIKDYNLIMIPSILIIILFVFIFYCLYIKLLDREIKIIKFFWEFKDLLFSSIMYPIITKTLFEEYNRHKNLEKNHYAYVDILYLSENYYKKIYNYNESIFYTTEDYYNFVENVKNNKIKKIDFYSFKYYSEKYIKDVKNIIPNIYEKDMEDTTEKYKDILNSIEEQIFLVESKKTRFDIKFLNESMINNSNDIFAFIVSCRKVWRYDSLLDKQITDIIEKNGTFLYYSWECK